MGETIFVSPIFLIGGSMTRFFGTGNFALLDYDKMRSIADEAGNPCYLVALDEFDILVLLSVVRLAEWFNTRWVSGDKDQVDAIITKLELCLMSGCNVQDLIQTQRMLIAAIVGQEIDFTASPTLPTSVDFTESGLGPRISALEVKLEEIRALEETNQTTNVENVDDIEEILDGIGQVLGAAAILA